MDVVWAYADWSERGCFDLRNYSFQLYVTVASVFSWMKYAPQFRRVIYVDESTHNLLCEKNLIHLWDKVEIVDFRKEIHKKYCVHFYAYPKMYAYTQQTEPFFICDTDVVLFEPIDNWFDPTKYWAVPYNASTYPNFYKNISAIDYAKSQEACKKSVGLSSFCNYNNSVNGCMLFFPDPKVGQLVGRLTMNLGSELNEEDVNGATWLIYEEALLKNLIEFISHEKSQTIPEKCFREYCLEDLDVDQCSVEIKEIEERLGFSLDSIYNV